MKMFWNILVPDFLDQSEIFDISARNWEITILRNFEKTIFETREHPRNGKKSQLTWGFRSLVYKTESTVSTWFRYLPVFIVVYIIDVKFRRCFNTVWVGNVPTCSDGNTPFFITFWAVVTYRDRHDPYYTWFLIESSSGSSDKNKNWP